MAYNEDMNKTYKVSLWVKLINIGVTVLLIPVVFLSFYITFFLKQYLVGSVMLISTTSITLFLLIRFIDLVNERIIIDNNKFIFFGYSYLFFGKNKKIEVNLFDIEKIALQRSIYSNDRLGNNQFASLIFKSKDSLVKSINFYNWSLLEIRAIVQDVAKYYSNITYTENINDLIKIDPKTVEI